MNDSTKMGEKILANGFCFFFVAQILSPMIGDRTIYLDFLLVVLNPFFILWISKYKISPNHIDIIILLGVVVVLGHPMTSAKFIFTFVEVAYLFYLYERRLWYVNRYILLSVLVAVIQFYGLFFMPEISLMFSPDTISSAVWGSYAMITNPNFYALMEDGIPHMSGLSREAGFMASLLLIGICTDYLFSKEGYWTTSKVTKVFYVIGYIITFTKMSLLIVPVYIIQRIRRIIKLVPLCIIFFFWVISMMVFWSYYQDFLLEASNITFLHRFGAYVSLWNLDTIELLFGIENIKKRDSFAAYTMGVDYSFFAGFGGWLVTNGLLSGIVYLLILWRLRVTSVGLLMLLLLTINVQVDTNQNFVVLAYFIIFKYYRFNGNHGDI